MDVLLKRIKKLDKNLKKIFNRIYEIKFYSVSLKLPHSIKKTFKEAEKQKIYEINNKILYTQTIFNVMRSKRREPISEKIQNEANDYFCDPLKFTPEDEIGRLENESAITSANLAKSHKYHSLVIFKKHNTYDLDLKDIKNGLTLGFEWFKKISKIAKKNPHFLIIWNNGYRAGASIQHPHFQIFALPSIPKKLQFFQERLRWYKQRYRCDYLDDLYKLSRALNLGKKLGSLSLIISLTPFKEKEIIFFGKDCLDEISYILLCYKEISNNFNFFLTKFSDIMFGSAVDRGSMMKKNCDIGSLEIFGYSVVGFDLIKFANEFFGKLESYYSSKKNF